MYRYIVAMSVDRAILRDKLMDQSSEIDEHIIKLLLYPNSSNCNHWKTEIIGFLRKTSKLKHSNKWPSEKFIFNSISCHNDTVDVMKEIVIEDYGEPSVDVSLSNIESALIEYQVYLAKELSSHGMIHKEEAYSILDRIVQRYSK